MISEALSKAAEDLRRAVASRHYREVQDLIVSFCSAAAAEARALPPRDPAIAPILSYVDQLLQWTHLMLSTARTACEADLRRIALLNVYLDRARTPAEALRLDG